MSAQLTITITESDFGKLHNSSMSWGKEWMKQKDRFTDAPLFTWKMAYWCETYLETLICQQYISSRGFESQTVFDTATLDYLILTNYVSEDWQ